MLPYLFFLPSCFECGLDRRGLSHLSKSLRMVWYGLQIRRMPCERRISVSCIIGVIASKVKSSAGAVSSCPSASFPLRVDSWYLRALQCLDGDISKGEADVGRAPGQVRERRWKLDRPRAWNNSMGEGGSFVFGERAAAFAGCRPIARVSMTAS